MQENQNSKPRAREAGFTLLEIIIAISILTFGILAVASMQTAAIRGNQLGYSLTEASTLAQDRLEFLLNQPYNGLSVGNDQQDPLFSITPPPDGYTIKYDVTDMGINAKLITMRVMLEGRGLKRTTELKCVRPQLL